MTRKVKLRLMLSLVTSFVVWYFSNTMLSNQEAVKMLRRLNSARITSSVNAKKEGGLITLIQELCINKNLRFLTLGRENAEVR